MTDKQWKKYIRDFKKLMKEAEIKNVKPKKKRRLVLVK